MQSVFPSGVAAAGRDPVVWSMITAAQAGLAEARPEARA